MLKEPASKNKVLVFERAGHSWCIIRLNGENLKIFNEKKHLGIIVGKDGIGM